MMLGSGDIDALVPYVGQPERVIHSHQEGDIDLVLTDCGELVGRCSFAKSKIQSRESLAVLGQNLVQNARRD